MELAGDTRLRYSQKYEQYISDVDPERSDYDEFLRASRGDGEAFRKRYGGLADKYLAATGGAAGQKEYSFAQYISDWRDDHCDRFVRSYAADFKELALKDFERNWLNTYHPMVQVESSLAQTRVKALRHGLVDKIRRNYASLVMGQAGRVSERIRQHAIYERVLKQVQAATAEGGR